MAEIAKVFFAECREGLDAMEAGLLRLEHADDGENLNTIFRAAHSIKGGAATFGFQEIAGFTHGIETLLDDMRNGVRSITPQATQVLLQCCDCLRDLMTCAEAGEPSDQARIDRLGAELARLQPKETAPAAPPPPAVAEVVAETVSVTVPVAEAVAVAAQAIVPAAAAAAEAIIPAPAAARASSKAGADAGSIRVATEKVDNIINLVGELLITQSMLSGFADGIDSGDLPRLRQGLLQLARNSRELQESVMQIRMLPISFAFNRFPRLVHDLSRTLGKKVDLKFTGEHTELDKTVLEKISDPLVHLVRNALDHGLETPERRLAAGKSDTGTLELCAFHEGGNIIIEVRDDGAGLNRDRILQKARERGLVASDHALSNDEIDNLIFMPGFSTAEQISDVSGRGVGMDVVRRNIADLGGHVQMFSEFGSGSRIRIRLPLTLAILDGQLVRVGGETYVISLLAIVETIQIKRESLSTIAGKTEVIRLRDAYLPVLKLYQHFGIEPDSRNAEDGLLVIVEADGTRVGLLVDDLLAQQQVVIKSLESNFKQVEGLAGATILGDGSIALIIDVPGLIRSAAQPQHPPSVSSRRTANEEETV